MACSANQEQEFSPLNQSGMRNIALGEKKSKKKNALCSDQSAFISFALYNIKYLKFVIQANAASAVDQLTVAQDRILALIISVFIAQPRRARRATWVTKYSIPSMLEISVLVTTAVRSTTGQPMRMAHLSI